MKIQFSTPTPDTPGFLRRTATAARLFGKLQQGSFTPGVVEELVDFLATFVTEPADRKEAREALLDVSQNDFSAMLAAIMGGGESAVPLVNGNPLSSGETPDTGASPSGPSS